MKCACLMSLITLISSFNIQAEEIDLRLYENRLISQHGEDGVLQKIFSLIGTTSKYCVEFGAGQGHFCSNTKYFREKFGWKGLLLDGFYEDNPNINLYREFITAENICNLFEKYSVPKEFDLLSIDIDRNDFYVWKALSTSYKPRVVIIEFSQWFNFDDDKVVKYIPDQLGDCEYTGASILALYKLGEKLGYSLVYQESAAVNLFFIRNDVVEATGIKFKNMNDVSKLYTGTPHPLDPKRVSSEFTSAANMLNE